MARLDAIRVWRAAETPQCQDILIDDTTGARCALGLLTGEEASTDIQASDWLDRHQVAVWGIGDSGTGDTSLQRCPLCPDHCITGGQMVAHWNDDHHLTFAQIADLAEQHPSLVFVDGARP